MIKKFVSLSVLLAVSLLLTATLSVSASSHREAPLISGDPRADATDVYAFVSPDRPDTVTIITNYYPFQEPAGGPNFFSFGDDVLYEIHIDNNGDAKEDITYQFDFSSYYRNPNTFLYNTGPVTSLDDPDLNFIQTYDVYRKDGKKKATKIAGGLQSPPNNVGPSSMPDYPSLQAESVYGLSGGSKVFAGQSDDPFFVELGGLFDLLTIRVLPGNVGGGVDGLRGYNVNSIALQVPVSQLTSGDDVIGVWTTSSRRSAPVLHASKKGNSKLNSGKWVQVSRLGSPLVNEVVIPLGKKDAFNASHPTSDGQFLSQVTNPELGPLLSALYGVAVPPQGVPGSGDERGDLVQVFLTGIPGLTMPSGVRPSEQLRLNTSIAPAVSPSRLGVLGGDFQGFPNGRRLLDDVTDIEVRAVAGATYFLVDPGFPVDPLASLLGDGVDANDASFRSVFPYLALPHSGFSSVPHP